MRVLSWLLIVLVFLISLVTSIGAYQLQGALSALAYLYLGARCSLFLGRQCRLFEDFPLSLHPEQVPWHVQCGIFLVAGCFGLFSSLIFSWWVALSIGLMLRDALLFILKIMIVHSLKSSLLKPSKSL